MSLDLSQLDHAQRLLFAIPLKPVQGSRFQPTGFPGLGAATFQTKVGVCLLVESAQSMANRLELTLWDEANDCLKPEVNGLSHVIVKRADGSFLTDTILEAHRLNSPYLLENSNRNFLYRLAIEIGMNIEVVVEEKIDNKKSARKTNFNNIDEFLAFMDEERNRDGKISIQDLIGPVVRKRLSQALLKLDIGSLLHGVFLAKKDLAGGRMRVARAMSAFVEADGVRGAASGGVKNDHVHPGKVEGDSKNLFGNIPYARDEFTAENIILYVNIDLAQIRGYGLGDKAERLLVLLSLYKLRSLLDSNLRLRTACYLEVDKTAMTDIVSYEPKNWPLPPNNQLFKEEINNAISECSDVMTVTTVQFVDELKKATDNGESNTDSDNEQQNED